jgi:hypothetical protein
MRIAVTHEKALQVGGPSVIWVSHQDNATRRGLDDPNPSPDRSLDNKICNVALCPHELTKSYRRNSKQQTIRRRARLYQSTLCREKRQLSREVVFAVPTVLSLLSIRYRQVAVDAAIENYKHIDFTVSVGKEDRVSEQMIHLPIWTEPFNHIFVELREGKVMPEITAQPIKEVGVSRTICGMCSKFRVGCLHWNASRR